MSKKMIIFTIKEHRLWKELWKNLKIIQSDGWDIKGLCIDTGKETGKGKVTEKIRDEFGEGFFTCNQSLPFTSMGLSKDEVKVFLVIQQGGAFDQGLQENANIISIIVRKYAEADEEEELFLILHSSGGKIGENYNQISEGASIKIHPPTEFIHDDTLIFQKIKKWVESNLKDGLDGLLNEVLGKKPFPDENKKILRHGLNNLRTAFYDYIQKIKNDPSNDFLVSLRDGVIKAGQGLIEREIEFYNQKIKGTSSDTFEISKTFINLNDCYKGIFSLFKDERYINKKSKILEKCVELFKHLNDIVIQLGGAEMPNKKCSCVEKPIHEDLKNANEYKILLIDDEDIYSTKIQTSLKYYKLDVEVANNEHDALQKIRSNTYRLILLDIYFDHEPKGKEIHDKIRAINNSIPIIVLSDEAVVEFNNTDFPGCKAFNKSGKDEYLADLIRKTIEKPDVPEVLEIDKDTKYIIGKTAAMKNVYSLINAYAKLSKDIVLITGESGTGKEDVAMIIHKLSTRQNGPFISLNCAAIPECLIEDELFGHEIGAYANASTLRRGKFEMADKGTLFLDEIGEMHLDLQAKLLRVIEGHSFTRLGGTEDVKIDVRVIAATNIDLEAALKINKFRGDLYYRLHDLPIKLPPLRERKEDIDLFYEYFVGIHNEKSDYKIEIKNNEGKFNLNVLSKLKGYDWLGNIRSFKKATNLAIANAIRQGRNFILPEDYCLQEDNTESGGRLDGSTSYITEEAYNYNKIAAEIVNVENGRWQEKADKDGKCGDSTYKKFIKDFNTDEKKQAISSAIINKLKELGRPYEHKDIATYFWEKPSEQQLTKLRQYINLNSTLFLYTRF